AAEWLRDLLDDSGLEVEFLEFPGIHTIPMEAVEKMGSLLEDALDG
ncbi:MAG TPA: phospholipase, partial [Planctomycetaceae bacterium]|nr:phospholipase [Planctomycetaceae bacterium]